jgi:hypothetical protein
MSLYQRHVRGVRRSMECPLWVISGHASKSARCPLYPRKRTFSASERNVAYFASIAVTSISIIMYGQASWGTFSNVDAGIGATPNASLRHFNAS